MRVEDCQVHWPEHLPDVEDIADYRVVDSFQYRQFLGPADRPFLNKKRNDTGNSRQRDQRDFLRDTLPQLTFDSVERPVVQKQEDKRQCYEHRLTHQSTCEKEYHRQIPSDPRYAHIVEVGQQRQHKEDTAEHILSFCNPGNRFHTQRMNCEHRRNKSASPNRSSHLLQRKKKEHCSQSMEEDVRKMMLSCLQPIQLAVDHVRNG